MNKTNHPDRVAIQGILGSFHHEACMIYFGNDQMIQTCLTFKELIKAVVKGEASHGLMAVENSLAGSMLPNLSLIRESGLSIGGELYMRITQNLMTLPGQSIWQLSEVHSHPLAIAQCEAFFEKYPHIRLVETADTAQSAREVAEKHLSWVGAIGAASAANRYGLKIIHPGIETNKENYTRFLLLEKQPTGFDPAGKVKASLAFVIPNKPGSLAGILAYLAKQGVDLTMIQSLPLVGQRWAYIFHADMVFENLSVAKSTIADLEKMFDRLWLMGVFKVSDDWGSAQQPREADHQNISVTPKTNPLQTSNTLAQ